MCYYQRKWESDTEWAEAICVHYSNSKQQSHIVGYCYLEWTQHADVYSALVLITLYIDMVVQRHGKPLDTFIPIAALLAHFNSSPFKRTAPVRETLPSPSALSLPVNSHCYREKRKISHHLDRPPARVYFCSFT